MPIDHTIAGIDPGFVFKVMITWFVVTGVILAYPMAIMHAYVACSGTCEPELSRFFLVTLILGMSLALIGVVVLIALMLADVWMQP